MLTAATFRVEYPEFADATKYPDVVITRLIGLAGVLLNADRWFDSLDYGTGLFVAHYLTMGTRNSSAAAAGGAGGGISGLMTSKAVDKVSAGYDVGAVTLVGAGHWNTTSYGVLFYQLLMMFGAGPIQL